MSHDFDQIIDRRGTYSTQWDFIADRFGASDILPFSISDTDFRAPQPVIDTLHKGIDHGIFGYSRWNHADFKESICHYYQRNHQTKIMTDWVVYSPSVLYSISLLLRMVSKRGEGILVFDPMYDAFVNVIKKNGRALVTVPLMPEEKYQIDFHLFEEQAKKCTVFLLCSPHNPTGKVFTQEEIARIVAICQKHHLYLISDEIHSDIILFENTHYPLMNWYNTYKRLAMVQSASKTFNLPGLGGSYALIPDLQQRERFLSQIKERDFVHSPSIPGMLATMTAYNECQEYTTELKRYIEENMQIMHHFLAENLPDVGFTLPQATYLAWLDFRRLPYSTETIQSALVQIGKVGIMRGDVYGENGHGFLRMNLGCPKTKLIEGLQRLKRALDYLKEG